MGSLKVKGEQLVLLTSGRSMVFGDRASSMTKAVIVRWQCRKKPRESTRETPKEDQRRETLYIQTPDQPLSRPHINDDNDDMIIITIMVIIMILVS